MRTHNALFTPHRVALAVACLCVGLARAQTAPSPSQLPSGGKVVGGAASISATGSTLNINQSSNRAAIDWNSFNVGSDARVNFNQPSASSVTLNRVVGGDPSQIMGRINAPGQVFISNASGVIFGAKSQVDVGGLLVTTLGISNEDFMAGKSSFSGNGTNASVVNQGTLQAALGGFVALLAPEVRNEGIIVAHQGTVALGAGNKATLVFSGNSLTTVEVDQGIIHALVENKHMLMADGGLVLMTARSASALMGSLVKNSGTVQAQTIANKNGRILLMGDMTSGTTVVDGTLDASAPHGGDGGFVETSAARVKIAEQARITTLAPTGKTGNWLVDPVDFTVADSGGDMTGTTLQSNLGTSNVELQSAAGATNGLGDVNINTSINWSANTTLTLTASNNVNINANMMATGSSAGLVIKPNTANTYLSVTQSASGSGVFNLLFGKYIKLTGANPTLRIAGQRYTVINSLGTQTSSGDGTLQGMRGNLSGYYALGSNIDASATSGWNSGAGFTPIADGSQFTGTFNGLGNNISSLYISSPSTTASTQNTGLFYTIGTAGNVSNLGIRSGTVQSLGTPGAIGSLAGINNGTILKSYSVANVSSAATTQAVGGLVGINNGTIQYSYASGSVTGGTSTRAIGGLIGVNTATVTESFATGNVLAGANSGGVGINSQGVGGLIGYSEGTVSGVYATGSVSVSGYGQGVGGLIGFGNSLTLSKAYSTGNIEIAGSAQNVGGLIAETLNSTVTDAYATGSIQVAGAGTEVGSLVGLHRNNTISNAYSTGQITLGSGSTQGFYGSSNSGGTFSNSFWNTTSSGLSTAPGKPGITGITGSQMQTLSTFSSVGWSTATWGQVRGQNSDFPVLGVGHSALYLRLVSSSSTYGSTPTLSYKLYNNDIAGIEVIGYRLSGTPSWKITQSGTAVAATTLAATSSAGIYSLTYASGLSLVNGNSGVFAGAANNWTINTKTLTASIATGSTVYGSSLIAGAVMLSGVVNGDSVSTASVVINTSGLLSGGGQLKVGSHLGIQSVSGVLSGAGAANYTFAGATGNYTVTPKTLTGLISASNSVYGANLVKGTVSLSGLVSGDNVIPDNTVSIALAAANKSTSGNLKAGSYTGIQTAPATLSGTPADIANYTYTGATGDYTVSKATLGGSITSSFSVYGSALVPGTANINGVIGTDVVTVNKVIVNIGGSTSTSGNLKADTHRNIQTIELKDDDDSVNYTFAGTVGDYIVTRLPLAGVLGAGSSVYGASLVPGVVTFSNKVAGDIVTATPNITTTSNTSTSGNLRVGSYPGIQSIDSSSLSGTDAVNYTLSGVSGDYVVYQRTLTGSIGSGASYFSDTLMPGTLTFPNKITGDDLIFTSGPVSVKSSSILNGYPVIGTYDQTASSSLSGADASNYSFTGITTSSQNYAVKYPDTSLTPLTITSAQMPVITSSSIAQFTPAQLQQLSATQLQSMSTSQVNAIPLANFSQLSGTQIGYLTNAQVAALPNSYIQSLSLGQLSGMTASQLGSMGLSQLAQLSATQIANLSASQIQGLTAAQLQNLSSPQLLALTNTQFSSMTVAQLQALSSLPLDKSLGSEAKTASTALADTRNANLIRFQSTSDNKLKPDQFGSFVSQVNNQLSLADIKGIQHLKPSQITALAPEQITAVSQAQLQNLNTNQLANLSSSQLKVLSANQLNALSPSQLAAFSDSQLSALSSTQWAALTENQLAALTPVQLGAVPATAFAKMRDSQLQSLTPTQLVNLSTDVFLALNKAQLGCLTCNQIKSLKPSQMASLPLGVFKDLVKKKADCMSAQQLASLTQEQLQHVMRTQTTEMGKEQLQAINATQLPTLPANQLQKLSAEQLRLLLPEQIAQLNLVSVRNLLKSLSAEQLQALTPAHIRGLQAADTVKLNALHIQALTPVQIAAIAPEVLAQFNKQQWREWSPEQIRSLQSNQLKALTPEQLSWLSPWQLNALTSSQMAQLLPSQIAGLSARQQQILLPEQWSQLQPNQLQAFTNPLLLTPPKSAADIVIDKDFQLLAADQFTPQKITLLLPDQMRLITPQQISGWNKTQLSSLAPTQWQLLSPEQWAAISPDVLKTLDPAALKNLSPVQWAAMNAAQWQVLTPAQLQTMPVSVLAKLMPEQWRVLSVMQTNALDKDQLAALSTLQLQALNPQQLAAWNVAQLQKLNAAQVASLTPAQLNQLNESQWKALTPEQVKQLQPAQLAALNPKSLNALQPEQLQSLTGTQLAALSPAQLGGLKSAPLQALTDRQMAVLTPAQLANLSPEQMRSLTPIQVNALTPVFFSKISPSVLQALSLNQWAAVSPQAIAAMDRPQIQSLTIVQVGNISPAQLEGLSAYQLQAFTPLQLNAIPPRMLWSMSNQQLQSFSPEQVAQFTPAQLNQLVNLLTPQQLTALDRNRQAALDNPSNRVQSTPPARPLPERQPNRAPPVLPR